MKEQKSPWKNGSIDGSIGGWINGDRMYGKRQSRWMYRWWKNLSRGRRVSARAMQSVRKRAIMCDRDSRQTDNHIESQTERFIDRGRKWRMKGQTVTLKRTLWFGNCPSRISSEVLGKRRHCPALNFRSGHRVSVHFGSAYFRYSFLYPPSLAIPFYSHSLLTIQSLDIRSLAMPRRSRPFRLCSPFLVPIAFQRSPF